MVSERAVINNPTGLHLRPAGMLCKRAMEYYSKITLRFNEYSANAKSVLGVLGACIKMGDEIEIICEGDDEEEALKDLMQLIHEGLGEEIPKEDDCSRDTK